MAHIRRNRFQLPTALPGRASQPEIVQVFEPVGGINRSRPPEHIAANEAVELDNMEIVDRYVRVRSGLTRVGDTTNTGTFKPDRYTFLGLYFAAPNSQEYTIAASTKTIATTVATALTAAWTPITDRTVSGISSSANSYYDHCLIFDPQLTDNQSSWLILANGGAPRKVEPFTAGASEISSWLSVCSMANYVASLDERLLFFNVASSQTKFTRRIWWSARGAPFDWTEANGAGYQDLVHLGGDGTGVAHDRDRLYIFSDSEIWQAIPRRDAFAFDFLPVNDALGCPYPRTIRETPAGVFFLGRDHTVYRISAGALTAFGYGIRDLFNRENVGLPTAIYGVYDESGQRYALFFPSSGSTANQALLTPVSQPAWQRWTSTSGNWEVAATAVVRYSSVATFQRPLCVAASDKSVYAFVQQQSTDAGREIIGRLRPPALNSASVHHLSPTEAWIEYESTSASTVSVIYSANKFSSSSAVEGGASLPSGGGSAFVPFTGAAARHPMVEIQLRGGAVDSRIGRIHLRFRPWTGRFGA